MHLLEHTTVCMYEERYKLEEELAHLSHYDSVEAMWMDTRGQVVDNRPFV